MKAMIFAAGLGTRLKPWTDHHPKALALVNNKPLLQRNIEYLKGFGISEIVINLHHFAEQVTEFLDRNKNFGCRIHLSFENDELLETGGGLKKASRFFDDQLDFLVMNSDILTNLDLSVLRKFHHEHRPLVTLAVTDRSSSRNFLFNASGQLCGWKNNSTGQERVVIDEVTLIPKAFSGIQIVNPEIFSLMHETGKFSLVDLYLRLAKKHIIICYDHSGDTLIDVGKPDSIREAEKYFV